MDERKKMLVICGLVTMLLSMLLIGIFGFYVVFPAILLIIPGCFVSNRMSNRLHPETAIGFRKEFN